jgi:hypothetical protein
MNTSPAPRTRLSLRYSAPANFLNNCREPFWESRDFNFGWEHREGRMRESKAVGQSFELLPVEERVQQYRSRIIHYGRRE